MLCIAKGLKYIQSTENRQQQTVSFYDDAQLKIENKTAANHILLRITHSSKYETKHQQKASFSAKNT